MLADLSDEDLVACIALINQWFEDDKEVEQERYGDESYSTPEAFLSDLDSHRSQREAMGKMLKILEEERDRRKAGSRSV